MPDNVTEALEDPRIRQLIQLLRERPEHAQG
jgi:hypothetical protein